MGKAQDAKRKRREQREAIAGAQYFHGGVAGLEVGSMLLSPAVTGDPTSVSTLGIREARRDRVYFTVDVELARCFAANVHDFAGHSAVYSVLPVGDLEVDPDYPTVGFQCVKARIISVVEHDVRLTKVERARRGQPYETYTDGRLIHDAAGRLQLSSDMEKLGFTQDYLDTKFPLWTPLETASRVLMAEVTGRTLP